MALHRVAEEIRIHFPNVDELINNGKKVFLKAPSRIQIFKTMAPDIPLPPRPVLTRWGTWLNASNANFSKLATSITQLETSGVPLIDSINFIQKIKADILKVPNQFGKIIYQKLTTTLNKNKGFKITSDISDILNGQGATNEIPDDLTVNDLAFFKYSLITSVDVERSFSIYKNLLADNRRSFLFENLKQALVVQCNSSECTGNFKFFAMKRYITMQNYFSAKKLNNENKSVDSSDFSFQGQDDITNNPEPELNTKISVASALKKCPGPSDISQNLKSILTFYPKTNIPSVSAQINEGHLKLIRKNRKYIKRIASVLLYTGTQCIAQRGDYESVKSLNCGNFLELLHLIDEQCEVVGQDVPQNAKYTSPQIQNEMISIFNQIILEKISFELQSCNYFALIVDETKDKSKTEQLSVVVRYYIQGSIHERFMGFKPAKQLNASSLLNYIKEILQKCSVDLQKCVAQIYDGAVD
ncbi:hypothetical protein QTP88_027120 [Uroleucon formosanum]